MKHVYQIVFYDNEFDYNLDDYVEKMIEGPLYATREAAEKHRDWAIERDPSCRCVVVPVAVREDFEPKKRK